MFLKHGGGVCQKNGVGVGVELEGVSDASPAGSGKALPMVG